jgi:tripartite-type tricarboxylate transporter receptor subunit TctC
MKRTHFLRSRALALTLTLGLAALLATGAQAQTAASAQAWPSKPIRLVVGYAPGGVADITARMIAQKISVSLGQQVIIENKPSAGLIVASEMVAKADPDGYTLLHLNYGNAVSAALYRTLPFDTVRDFAPVSAMGFFDVMVLANKGSSLSSVKDIIAMAKASPEKLNIGTVSIGSGQYMAASLFKAMTGLNLTIVPFKSTPALISALKSNDIQVAFEIGAPVMSLVRSGDLKALSITSAKRFATLPDVPTMAESGVAGYQVTAWNGIAAPAKTPRAIIERLNREVNAALADPDIRQKFQNFGIDARGGSPEDLRDLLAGEIAKWKNLVETTKMEKQ